ncbi:hypothetical protein CHRY9390_01060 [Chryseobacterium aquaeductus]|uniref:Uncharacterized protein n=1 Tax=Chryseobacterium aquaeductus TaxID=2675056 RepID=A0A9N8MFV1_9FLAO|nr:hypothetical protein CHRY9390_01060 [Chryseobacterium potabilaquae]CAD7803315.1 hypothetical protein CHRY9390_01060 [Chryseobacterium aquaeductus]
MHEFYLLVIFLCLVFTFKNKLARQRFLYLYFFVVFITELLIYVKYFDGGIYQYTKVFYILFFVYYFKESLSIKRLNGWILIFLIPTYFLLLNYFDYAFLLSILQSFLYVLLSLEWFRLQIKTPDDVAIYKKQKFWISVGILLWGTIYLMRYIPALFFANNAFDFFSSINLFYQAITTFVYILFLRGVFCFK